MNKIEAKIAAYKIASIVVYELEGSECTDSIEVKNEIHKIAVLLAKKADELKHKIELNKHGR